ncbi:MAG: helix-turn-helix transcriptional regulator [Cyanobacteriota bacterium]
MIELEKQGERLKEVREATGLTQEEFATNLEIKSHKVKDIENRKIKLPIDLALKIEQKFSFNFKWLLTGIGEKHSDIPVDDRITLECALLEKILSNLEHFEELFKNIKPPVKTSIISYIFKTQLKKGLDRKLLDKNHPNSDFEVNLRASIIDILEFWKLLNINESKKTED